MSRQRIEADLRVGGFGLLFDDQTRRLDFPHGEIDGLRGWAGDVEYGAREVVLEKLFTRLDRAHWQAEEGSATGVHARLPDGKLELTIDRVQLPHGVSIKPSAGGGAELRSPFAILEEVVLRIPSLDALRTSKGAEAAADALRRVADVPLRQEKLRWLDSLVGELRTTVKVVLDLPVVGKRTLDQVLKIPIKDGSLDYRSLDRSLNWLEGTFIDLALREGRLALTWKVPIFVRSRELISFELDEDARTLATFDRVPLRSFADFRLPKADVAAAAAAAAGQAAPEPDRGDKKKKGVLQSLTLGGLEVELSMTAPHHVEVGGGVIQFGGDDAAGVLGLKLGGSLVHPPGPGQLVGSLGVLDLTAKDLPLGPIGLTVDRLHLDGIDSIEVAFDGFHPVGLTAVIHRMTASNLALHLAP